jgi:hypothetical protein
MRRGENLACPGCGKVVFAYVPAQGDGSAYRLPKHKEPRGDTPCEESDNFVSWKNGQWEQW